MDAFDQIELDSPEIKKKFPRNNGKGDAFDQLPDENQEPWWKDLSRTALQIPQALADTTTPGIIANMWQMLAVGEVMDPEEIEHIEMIAKREGVPFDKEAYIEAAENALNSVPTVSNIAREVEEKTGIPLEPKTRIQKGLRFLTTASRLSPKGYTIRGMNTSLPKPVLGAAVEGTKEVLTELGLPEQVSELASFGILKQPTKGSGSISIGSKQKPSGLTERNFEKTQKPKEISETAYKNINEKVGSDFKNISDQIIKESPVGETFDNLRQNPAFKQESRELIKQAQEIADEIPGNFDVKSLKKEYADISAKKTKGFAESEYDIKYKKFMKEASNSIDAKKNSPGKLVEQYRKNNDDLTKYFEPGSSKALNNAKRDSLLDQNRAIANFMEKNFPESELSSVFKEGNERWTKIMDAEAVDSFVDELFKDKINYKKMNEFFDQQGYEFKFKRALGEKGYKDFQQLLKDTLSSESAYKMLNVAKDKGYNELFTTGLAYILHPELGTAKFGFDASKKTYKGIINTLIDKPQIGITWKEGIKDLKKGDFKSAEKKFNILNNEIITNESKELLRQDALKKYNKKDDLTINTDKDKSRSRY